MQYSHEEDEKEPADSILRRCMKKSPDLSYRCERIIKCCYHSSEASISEEMEEIRLGKEL